MTVGPRVLSIQEFLLADVLGADIEVDDVECPTAPVRAARLGLTYPARLPLKRAKLRAEIERHSDRTMRVVSYKGIETITRCRTCAKDDTRPCLALRVLAVAYGRHPAYRPEWRIPRPDPRPLPAQWSPRREH